MENSNLNIPTNDAQKNDDAQHVIDKMTIDEIIAENERRKTSITAAYDPIAGVGCCNSRVPYTLKDKDGSTQVFMIPTTMVRELDANKHLSAQQFNKLRIKHDFEFWCATCVTILDKVTGRMIKLTLNRPQRRVLQMLEQQRLAKEPLRMIMLKARQWGGSTLVQMYMIWIQLVLKKNWNSVICGHLHQTAAAIKSMYNRVLRRYPKELSPEGKQPQFVTFEGSRNVRQLSGSESLIITASAQSEDAIRGYDVKMAHLTEVAFWPDTPQHQPDDLIRSIGGTIPLEPLTMIVLESTANGVGNYFHKEWQRAKKGESDKKLVFVPWHEIEIYQLPVTDAARLLAELDDYEKELWENNCTLEQINWYHNKRREYSSQVLMAAEFPSNDIEAFATNDRSVFDQQLLEPLRKTCNIIPVTGDMVAKSQKSLAQATFVKGMGGNLMKVWKMPEATNSRNRYLVTVDVGGRNENADWSVIAVFDTHNNQPGAKPEVVAQWRGHIDKDLMAWKAAQIARFYNNALLVFESNTLESDGEVGKTIFESIAMAYNNLYCRTNTKNERVPGFHTNSSSKKEAIDNLQAYVRDQAYIERDEQAINEMVQYQLLPNGKSYGAQKGGHDDILMTRAIALLIIEKSKNNGASRAESCNNFIHQNPPALFYHKR